MTIPREMTGVQLTGYGGLEKLVYRHDLVRPEPAEREVLIQVSAAGMNNTDINSRTGWYAKSVEEGTTEAGGSSGFGVDAGGMGDWTGDIVFPRIQGADVVGRIVAVGPGVPETRIGEHVLCNPYLGVADDPDSLDQAGFLGAERDGAFAQFMTIPASNAHLLPTDLSVPDTALATLPCSGGTAMNMLLMAGIKAGDKVLVTGASGGVGSFLVQIAKHFGAEVVALVGAAKRDAVLALGADTAIDRSAEDWVQQARKASGGEGFTLVADVVGGAIFTDLLALLRRGGRFVTAGAIAGPLVTLDLRTLYLKNLSFFGSAVFLSATFPTLLRVLAEGGLKPAVAEVSPLSGIRDAQERFLEKRHVGSLVLIPPPLETQLESGA